MSSYTLWMLCHDCGYEWRADFTPQGFALHADGEECIECGSDNIESTGEYNGPGAA